MIPGPTGKRRAGEMSEEKDDVVGHIRDIRDEQTANRAAMEEVGVRLGKMESTMANNISQQNAEMRRLSTDLGMSISRQKSDLQQIGTDINDARQLQSRVAGIEKKMEIMAEQIVEKYLRN